MRVWSLKALEPQTYYLLSPEITNATNPFRDYSEQQIAKVHNAINVNETKTTGHPGSQKGRRSTGRKTYKGPPGPQIYRNHAFNAPVNAWIHKIITSS